MVQHGTIDRIIQLVQNFGENCLTAKKNIHVSPIEYHLLVFCWDNVFYLDRCLPMWASSSRQVFERMSVVLQWVMQSKYKAVEMSLILDDFF